MGGEMMLKPCPFCGSPAVLERDSDHHGEWFNLGCARHWGAVPDDQEPCIGGREFYTEIETSEADAIAAWNRRSPDPELVEALSDAEYKLSCLIQRFSEDSIGGYFGAPEDTCTADELCGHWSCAEAGCLKDARDDSRALLSRIREGGELERDCAKYRDYAAAKSNEKAEAVREAARLREALERVASCQSHHPGDVVAIARTALGRKA